MLEAWLAGNVPPEVMADWCEERGIAFSRGIRPPTRTRMEDRERLRSAFSSSVHQWCWSDSSCGSKTLGRSYSCSRTQFGGMSRSGKNTYGQSHSGSRTSASR